MPFLIIFITWWILGINFNIFFITIFNSISTSIIISLGFATLCSWWFSLTRNSSINVPISLSLILTIIIIIFEYLLSIESIQPSGLYTPLAIFLNNLLESLTILLSLGFVILIGLLISKENYTEEE
jgi:hypothetical protein